MSEPSTGCPLHTSVVRDFEQGEKRMDRFESKIDNLLTGQANQAVSIQALKDAIGNGLRGDIKRTMECVESLEAHITRVCTSYDAQLEAHDKALGDFKWFRDWANRFRDSLTVKLLTIAFLGGTIIGIVYMFERGILRLFK